ncbi:hypothetical protein FFLO_02833 [Filobasidium floriforme]|uniref:Uncharacterized protein n=1 Tax=Filobasidium floriforme TaxID=5210 RepID=A0A8K0NQX1_9TREE|nr:hypothetical protein FFLO_02833 [Filobasidium floriforme]
MMDVSSRQTHSQADMSTVDIHCDSPSSPALLTAHTSRERESKTVNMLETSGNTRIYALMRYIHVAMWLLFPKVMAMAMCQATCYVMHMGAVDRTFSMKLSTSRAPIDLHYRVERPDPGYRYLRHHAIDASPSRDQRRWLASMGSVTRVEFVIPVDECGTCGEGYGRCRSRLAVTRCDTRISAVHTCLLDLDCPTSPRSPPR